MKLLPTQIDESSLLHLGKEVVALFKKCDFPTLADRFDYAMAYDRIPAAAIEEDLHACIAAFNEFPKPQTSVLPSMVVKYFKPNSTGLFAVIECTFDTSAGCPINADLIVASRGEDKYIYLEDVSLAAVQNDR